MKLSIDTDAQTIAADGVTLSLFSAEAFELLSRLWLQVGWSRRHSYSFAWLGRPIIQLPEDLMRLQDAIYLTRPDVIVETGIAHGGSLIFHASLCHALGNGRVVGIDVDIRPHNRAAIENHPLARYITLVEGSSTDAAIVEQVHGMISPSESVLVILDSNHSYAHVSAELDAYADLVTPGSYLLVQDGVMHDLAAVPGGQASWVTDNPCRAAVDFVARRPDFAIEEPPRSFDESLVTRTPTYWPRGWLKRRK